MTEFVRGCFVKCISDREVAFFYGFLCIESVPSVGLGFIQIRSCKVLLSLCTCNAFCFSHFYILIYGGLEETLMNSVTLTVKEA